MTVAAIVNPSTRQSSERSNETGSVRRRQESDEESTRPAGEGKACRSARHGEYEALRQELPEKSRPARTDGEADRDLPAPSRRSGEEQVGEVRTGYEQHDRDDRQQRDERAAIGRSHIGQPSGRRLGRQRPGEVLFLIGRREVGRHGRRKDPGRDRREVGRELCGRHPGVWG